MTNIEESAITKGITEFEKFKALAGEAIERCKKAESEASYLRGQNEMLEKQKQADDARHRADLSRISELESFVSHILEEYRSAEEKLRVGHFRRPNSVSAAANLPAPSLDEAVQDEIRRLNLVANNKA